MYGPIQCNRREAAEVLRGRLEMSAKFAAQLVQAMGDDHVRSIQQSARHSEEIGDELIAEAIYQHRIRLAGEERIRNLSRLERRRSTTPRPAPGESKTRRRMRKPPDDPLQKKLFR